MSRNKKKKKKLFRKDLKWYFASNFLNHFLSFLSAGLCIALALWLSAFDFKEGMIAALIVAFILLADACNFVLLDSEELVHFHLFRFNEPVLRIPLCGIRTVTTSLEKNKPVVFIGGAYTHVTVYKNKKFWNDLIGKLIPDQELRQRFLESSEACSEKTDRLQYKIDRVMVPQLFGTITFISHELEIRVDQETDAQIYEAMEEEARKSHERP